MGTLATIPPAHAGTEVIYNCPAAQPGNSDAGPWTVFGGEQASKSSCAGGPGDWIGPRGPNMEANASDGVKVTVPAGSGFTIHEAKVWWKVPRQIEGADNFAVAYVNGGGIGEAATSYEQVSTPSVFIMPSTTTFFEIADYCSADDAGRPCVLGPGESPNLMLYGAQLTLADNRLPTGKVTGGGLTSTGPLSGTESLTYSAEDPDTGVRLVRLLVDGQPVASNDYIARCPYTNFQACPGAVSDTISWNTALVPDGQHSVQAVVEDAAQNTSVIYTATITTDNAPVNPTTTTVVSPGSGGSAGPGTAVGAPNGTPASESAVLHLSGPSTLHVPYARRTFKIAGHLTDSQGHPIANATLDILQTIASNSTPTALLRIRTGSTGSFTAQIPPGPSRRVQIAYRAFAGEPDDYAATATVLEDVEAGVRITARSYHTGPTGTVEFKGKVSGPTPHIGAIVDLLVYYNNEWVTVRTPRTKSNGTFKMNYKFHAAIGQFPFRVAIPAGQANFPYTHGYSNTITITTR